MNGEGVVVDAVSKTMGERCVLASATFAVPRGARVHLRDRNGGTASNALIRILAGVSRPSKGSVTVLGRNPRGRGASRPRVGVMLDDVHIPYGGSVRDFLTYFARLDGQPQETAHELLSLLGIASEASSRCDGLSRATARLVLLAQAVLAAPVVLLLHEPTAHLDALASERVVQVVRELCSEATILVAAGERTFADEYSERIYLEGA